MSDAADTSRRDTSGTAVVCFSGIVSGSTQETESLLFDTRVRVFLRGVRKQRGRDYVVF